jgi:hypothetical protein
VSCFNAEDNCDGDENLEKLGHFETTQFVLLICSTDDFLNIWCPIYTNLTTKELTATRRRILIGFPYLKPMIATKNNRGKLKFPKQVFLSGKNHFSFVSNHHDSELLGKSSLDCGLEIWLYRCCWLQFLHSREKVKWLWFIIGLDRYRVHPTFPSRQISIQP